MVTGASSQKSVKTSQFLIGLGGLQKGKDCDVTRETMNLCMKHIQPNIHSLYEVHLIFTYVKSSLFSALTIRNAR